MRSAQYLEIRTAGETDDEVGKVLRSADRTFPTWSMEDFDVGFVNKVLPKLYFSKKKCKQILSCSDEEM